jgi:N-acetylglutamate synthase-like GNAT family acetyltransferase
MERFEHIKRISGNDLLRIEKLVRIIWPIAYKDIISSEQIEYMLVSGYSIESLILQSQNQQFYVVTDENNVDLGFVALEHFKSEHKTKIHKLYVLNNIQQKGLGTLLINFATTEAKNTGNKLLFLNVNKFNSAQKFYTKLGFEITKDVVIDIGNGYVMDDYIMEKKLI